jgi:hypothetical protein
MLRQLARRARALAPAGEGVAARLMTTKVNQVVGAPMETYDRKVRRGLDARALPSKRRKQTLRYGHTAAHPSREEISSRLSARASARRHRAR